MKVLRRVWIAIMLAPAAALAVSAGDCPSQLGSAGTGACANNLVKTISNVTNIVLMIIGVIAVLFLIIGGFQYITSSGNPEQVQKAKNTIFYAIIGIVVALLAYIAVSWLLGQLTRAE